MFVVQPLVGKAMCVGQIIARDGQYVGVSYGPKSS